MKTYSKILSLLLSVVILMTSALLVSCDKDGEEPVEPAETTTIADVVGGDTPTEADTEAPAEGIVIVKDGVCDARVIRSDDVDASSIQVNCAADVRLAVQKATGVPTGIDTDWLKAGGEYDSSTTEILVGYTGYNETAQVYSQLKYGEYVVKVVGNKIVVAGYTDTAVYEGCRKLRNLISEIGTEGNLVIPADTLITGTVDKMLSAVPSYSGGVFDSTYECGGDATLILFEETDIDAYNKYLDTLSAAGWTQYTTNTVSNNSFATYTNENYTMNLGFYDYEDATRIIVEPLAAPVGLASDNVYEKVTTTQITMLGLDYFATRGEHHNIGLSMVIRLADGRFIVIDGGSNNNEHYTTLVDTLTDQSAEYRKSGEKVTIAAWIITHPHGDHSGMIGKQYSKFSNMNVERFMVNFMSDSERNKAMNSSSYGGNWDNGEGGGWVDVATAAKKLGAELQYVHVGQVFHIADVKIDVLYTVESYAPKICNAFNTTSLTLKFTFDSGDTFLMTGDTTGAGMQIAAKTFGDYMQCDILQVSHHGCGTWSGDSGMIYAYGIVDPETLLWPASISSFPNYKSKKYNIVLFSKEEGGSNPNYKECLIAGAVGDRVIVPIPYTVGGAIESRVS